MTEFPAFISVCRPLSKSNEMHSELTPTHNKVGRKTVLRGIMSHPDLLSPLNQFLPMNLLPQEHGVGWGK